MACQRKEDLTLLCCKNHTLSIQRCKLRHPPHCHFCLAHAHVLHAFMLVHPRSVFQETRCRTRTVGEQLVRNQNRSHIFPSRPCVKGRSGQNRATLKVGLAHQCCQAVTGMLSSSQFAPRATVTIIFKTAFLGDCTAGDARDARDAKDAGDARDAGDAGQCPGTPGTPGTPGSVLRPSTVQFCIFQRHPGINF